MSYHEHRHAAPENVNCAVLIISDTRTEQDDESGKLIKQRLADNGHKVMSYGILKNDADAIRAKIEELVAQAELQVIITSGGTGASSRDVTVDTVEPMLEKRLDGFGELFRQLTYQEIGTGSILSRAVAGVIRGRVVLCFPGSVNAATLAMDKIILPEIGHLVREATR
ncbi:MAG TPA: MogA/MoaB family molybdenum cofactor biosynthesis protein [Dehalococcoidia bacterium]|nr:MogA/MoaB family molybdenum cofactor biosynthesis protein [Dehalococcoidia bacterium]